MNPALVELVRTTLRAPRDAAGQIMALRLTRDVLWTALALVAVGNAALLFVIFQTSDTEFPLPGYVERPLALFVIIAGMMVIYVHGMYWAGLALGGSGSLDDVLALVIWFQTLRALAQVAIRCDRRVPGQDPGQGRRAENRRLPDQPIAVAGRGQPVPRQAGA